MTQDSMAQGSVRSLKILLNELETMKLGNHYFSSRDSLQYLFFLSVCVLSQFSFTWGRYFFLNKIKLVLILKWE